MSAFVNLSALFVADKPPSATVTVSTYANHIRINNLVAGIVATIRNRVTKQHFISGFFSHPFQCLDVSIGSVIPFIVTKKVYLQQLYSLIYHCSDTAFHPLFRSWFVSIYPVQMIFKLCSAHHISYRNGSSFDIIILHIGSFRYP